MPSESELQRIFVQMIGRLIEWAYENGYEFTFGEAFRTDEQAEINAIGPTGRAALVTHLRRDPRQWGVLAGKIMNNSKGGGIRNSLHGRRLAVDLNLFVDGVYQTDSAAYKPLGDYWESIGGSWGGHFGDGNHFSLSPDGGATR